MTDTLLYRHPYLICTISVVVGAILGGVIAYMWGIEDDRGEDDAAPDCGHGQVVQNGCAICEGKIGYPLEDDDDD